MRSLKILRNLKIFFVLVVILAGVVSAYVAYDPYRPQEDEFFELNLSALAVGGGEGEDEGGQGEGGEGGEQGEGGEGGESGDQGEGGEGGEGGGQGEGGEGGEQGEGGEGGGSNSGYYESLKLKRVAKKIQVEIGSEFNPLTGTFEAKFEWQEVFISCCVPAKKDDRCAKNLHNKDC